MCFQLFYLTMDVTVRKTGIPIKRTMVSLNSVNRQKIWMIWLESDEILNQLFQRVNAQIGLVGAWGRCTSSKTTFLQPLGRDQVQPSDAQRRTSKSKSKSPVKNLEINDLQNWSMLRSIMYWLIVDNQVRVYDSVLVEELNYKAILISEETTVEDVIRSITYFSFSSHWRFCWVIVKSVSAVSSLLTAICDAITVVLGHIAKCVHFDTFLHTKTTNHRNTYSSISWVRIPSWFGLASCLQPQLKPTNTQMGNIDQTFTHAPHPARLAQ